MGLILRQLYLLAPTFLACIAFVWLIITFLDQIAQSPFLISSLYFLELRPVALSSSSDAASIYSNTSLAESYTIGLWNSCANFANGTATCTTPTPAYTFDYLAAIDLLGGALRPVEALLPSSWTSTLATYHAAMIWLFASYCAALGFTAATILAGLFAYIHSSVSTNRTAFLAWLAAIFSLAASTTATALFLMIRNIAMKNLGIYGMTAVMGTRLLGYSWAGSGFMLAAAFLWLFRCCRCDGLRSEIARERERRNQRERQRLSDSTNRGLYPDQLYSQGQTQERSSTHEPLSGWQTGRPWSQMGPGADDKLPSPQFMSQSMPHPMLQPMGMQPQWFGQRGSAFEPMLTPRRVWIGGMGGMGMQPVMVWEQNTPPMYM